MLTSLETLWSHFCRRDARLKPDEQVTRDEQVIFDEQVNKELIHTCADAMFRYGTRFVRDHTFVRDCIQDVFVDLWDKREKIEAGQIKTYLFKALRVEIQLKRSEGLNDTAVQDDTLMQDDNYKEDDQAFPIEFDLDSPPGQKELLYLRLYEGFDPDQIAEIMGLNRENFATLTLNSS